MTVEQVDIDSVPPSGALNTPPMMPPFPNVPGAAPGGPMGEQQVGAAIAAAARSPEPQMGATPILEVELPAGYITPINTLISTAQVRELTGYDEEKLARISPAKNIAVYLTEMLMLGVTSIGGEQPDLKMIRSLLIGDREALVLGIRRATYGDTLEFPLVCDVCGKTSQIEIELEDGKDVKVTKLDNPLIRTFEVPLRRGRVAEVGLVNGFGQEAFSVDFDKRTAPEINTVMLAHSVLKINGVPTNGRDDAVRGLSSADRATLVDFISAHQPGPNLRDIPVNCATCGEEYPISLGIGNLFRF